MMISHYLFTDDTLIMCDAPVLMSYLHCTLLLFGKSLWVENKFGQILMGDIEDLDALADIIGCKVLNLPLKYLGFYLGARFNLLAIWHIFLNVWRSSWQGGRGFIF